MRYLLAYLIAVVLIGGCSDADDAVRTVPEGDGTQEGRGVLPLPAVLATPGEALDATPTPTPIPVESPATVPDVPGAAGSGSGQVPEVQETLPGAPQPTPLPRPLPSEPLRPPPAAGTLVHDVQLTVYTCYGDSTGAYCPGGNSMYCGKQVYRGAAACRWEWPCGQRFRIVGDPYDMVYTCEDRGGAVTGIDVWFMDYYAPETQAWRNALPWHVTVELLN